MVNRLSRINWDFGTRILCYVLPDFSSEEKQDRKNAIDEVIKDCEDRGMEIMLFRKFSLSVYIL